MSPVRESGTGSAHPSRQGQPQLSPVAVGVNDDADALGEPLLHEALVTAGRKEQGRQMRGGERRRSGRLNCWRPARGRLFAPAPLAQEGALEPGHSMGMRSQNRVAGSAPGRATQAEPEGTGRRLEAKQLARKKKRDEAPRRTESNPARPPPPPRIARQCSPLTFRPGERRCSPTRRARSTWRGGGCLCKSRRHIDPPVLGRELVLE